MKGGLRLFPLLLCALLVGCGRKAETSGVNVPAEPPASSSRADATPVPEIWNQFSGDKAFTHVTYLVNIGPRPSGSAEDGKARAYIVENLRKFGWQVSEQKFDDATPRGSVSFVNVIARYGATATTQRAIVCSHFDTKIFDTIRFVGASDGGSSTGALLELARVLALDPALAEKIELVFFDGEEAVSQFTETDGLYGSRYFARQLRETKQNTQFQFGILWDMIGDKNLTITLSPDSPAKLASGILAAADALHCRENFSYYDRDIYDDHVPLNVAHIPSIDLIDFDYPPWHTADDTLDKLSPESVRKVGAVTLFYLRQVFPK